MKIGVGLFPDAGFALGRTTQLEPPVMEIQNGLSARCDERDVRTVASRGRTTIDWLRQSEDIDSDFIMGSVPGS